MKFLIKKILIEKSEQNQQIGISYTFIKWIIYGTIIGLLCGIASGIFLYLLKIATNFRENYKWIILFLPVAGIVTTWLYLKYGKNSSRGNNLILEEIQNKKEKIPGRMGFLILITTVISHLFGASVGREGTAVQMGGALSEFVSKILKCNERDRRILLMSGISGGFGSVFGTPLAGAIFGMEISSVGVIKYEALLPCFVSSFVGNMVARTLMVKHLHYDLGKIPLMTWMVLVKVIIASILFGLVAVFFSRSMHTIKNLFNTKIKKPYMRPVIGGVIIIIMTLVVQNTMFNGLSEGIIANSFDTKVPFYVFLGKIFFTVVSLGSGFFGGEVTPIFVTGAAFGNFIGQVMNMPLSFMAALGLIAVFSGASNAPMACFFLGIEMFGGEGAVYFFMASMISYMYSGHSGIYTSQVVAIAKSKLLHKHEGEKIKDIE